MVNVADGRTSGQIFARQIGQLFREVPSSQPTLEATLFKRQREQNSWEHFKMVLCGESVSKHIPHIFIVDCLILYGK